MRLGTTTQQVKPSDGRAPPDARPTMDTILTYIGLVSLKRGARQPRLWNGDSDEDKGIISWLCINNSKRISRQGLQDCASPTAAQLIEATHCHVRLILESHARAQFTPHSLAHNAVRSYQAATSEQDRTYCQSHHAIVSQSYNDNTKFDVVHRSSPPHDTC